ncbi:MAG: winged helix-turn-helix transcriptional regulator [Treponema sp.]|jgi:CTP:phosphocholine cytidylyltransferase-like protein/predicted transcriptional regulator|nr:winged helix-turn-helix transcriptional regulator [Treponema sp.]
MSLTKNQFDILTFLADTKTEITQRVIAKASGLSVGTVNKTLNQLADAKLVDQDGQDRQTRISDRGLKALEPYRVKRAIFIAAGFGSRLVPITLNTPKPLVRVKGMRIIDTLLDAVTAAGIEEIIIVRGYLGEQFDQLLYKYPNIKFLENPLYNEANNISSAMIVRYQLQNAYVLESDLLLRSPKFITKYQYDSNYLGVPVERTDDWCFETKNGIITKLKVGGRNCHHMFGISYWNKQDGAKLAEHIKQVYEMPGGKERYWDQAALEYFIKDYEISVRECSFDDITEIDTFSELKKLDETYRV